MAAYPVWPLPVPEDAQQLAQLVVAAVDVADDVERPALVGPVGPGPLADDRGRLDLLDAAQHEDPAEPLAVQAAQRAPERADLAPDRVRRHGAIDARPVALQADPFGHVEDDRHRDHVTVLGDAHQRPPGVGIDVRGVDDGQPPQPQPQAGHVVESVERLDRDGHVVLVIADQGAEGVGGQHLRGAEMPRRERRFARAARADQHHQRELGNGDLRHRQNTAIWVGGPTSGSASPTGSNRTA